MRRSASTRTWWRPPSAPLKKGEVLDGEGGFLVWGKQVPADVSLKQGYLPLGLAHNVALKRDIAEGECIKWADVAYDAAPTR